MNDQLDNKDGMLLLRVAKCVAIPLNTEAPVPVTNSSAGHIYMALHPELDAQSIGSAGLRNCKCPATRVNADKGRKFSERAEKILERIVNRSRNRSTGRHCPPGPSCDRPFREEREGVELACRRPSESSLLQRKRVAR